VRVVSEWSADAGMFTDESRSVPISSDAISAFAMLEGPSHGRGCGRIGCKSVGKNLAECIAFGLLLRRRLDRIAPFAVAGAETGAFAFVIGVALPIP